MREVLRSFPSRLVLMTALVVILGGGCRRDVAEPHAQQVATVPSAPKNNQINEGELLGAVFDDGETTDDTTLYFHLVPADP